MRALIASHGKMASGVKNTLSMFIDTKNISCIDAYCDNEDFVQTARKFIEETKDDEISIIFTDILGGSVNQKISEINKKDNVKIIAGFNVALILEIMTTNITNEETLVNIINEAKKQMTLVKLSKNNSTDESDDDFLK